jgi:hypothetical protein
LFYSNKCLSLYQIKLIMGIKIKSLHELDTFIGHEEIPNCPQCGSRTDFIELSEDKQQHQCLDSDCKFEFFLDLED